MTHERLPAASRHILIIEDNSYIAMGMKSDLERFGHVVVGIAGNAAEAVSLYRTENPDLLLVDIRLENEQDGLELTDRLVAERPCPVLIVTAHADQALIARSAALGAYGYLLKPATPEALRAQVEIAVQRFEENQNLRRKNIELERTIETRKLVERAKGLLMKRLNLDENAAHRRLQAESQKRRISIGDCAQRVIDAEKTMGRN